MLLFICRREPRDLWEDQKIASKLAPTDRWGGLEVVQAQVVDDGFAHVAQVVRGPGMAFAVVFQGSIKGQLFGAEQ